MRSAQALSPRDAVMVDRSWLISDAVGCTHSAFPLTSASVAGRARRRHHNRPQDCDKSSMIDVCLGESSFSLQLLVSVSHVHTHTQHKPRVDVPVYRWSQDKIFDMVADIDAYQNFLPWCSDSRVLSKVEDGCTAEIAVGFPPINERYISEVRSRL